MRIRRSILFFAATRPDRLPKAVATGADAVCCDLEDAVGPADKAAGREAAAALLLDRPPLDAELIVRLNSIRTEDGVRDLLMLAECQRPPDSVMIPKVATAADVEWVDGLLGRHHGLELIAMVETARGLAAAESIAAASPRVTALFLGGVDLASELGSSRGWDAMLYPRSRVVHAASLAGVAAIDMPFLDLRDPEALDRETRNVRGLGFAGRSAIHPSQVATIQAAFLPSQAELARARQVIEAYERNLGGVLLVDGVMIERPVILAAQRTLALAGAAGRTPA
jgi:citrate lyase beta subunit